MPERLEIDCSVSDDAAFENVFIRSVWVDHFSHWTPKRPSDNAVQVWPKTGGNDDETIRSVSVDVTPSMLPRDFGADGFAGEMVYVLVEWGGVPDYSCLPCGSDDEYVVGVALDWRRVYEEGMSLVRRLLPCADRCADRSAFTDFVLRWAALKLAVATCDLDMAAEAWRSLFGMGAERPALSGGCGCGRR